MQKMLLALLAAASFLVSAEPVRSVAEYNLAAGVGLKGYDPVSYFPEGGGQPAAGQLAEDYLGVRYLLGTAMSRSAFLIDPAKYEPAYGGWCAWAMALGYKVDIQPQFYLVDGRRLHVFANKRARDNFASDVTRYAADADRNWRTFSGEEPRL